jgi:hypothetical protein
MLSSPDKNASGKKSMPRFRSSALALAAFVTFLPASADSQLPLSPPRDAGQTVTPAYEGWYPNPDGSFSMSFGYFNRNTEEVVEIEIGPDNFFDTQQDLGQPAQFHPQRHWGVFTVRVPADFGGQRLTWTLVNKGQTFAIPGHLHPDWLLDAKLAPATGNTPPVLKFDSSGLEGAGPDGVTTGPLAATVGIPLSLTVWATDDEVGKDSTFLRQEAPILLTWFKHRGPGAVELSEPEPEVDKEAGGRSTTTAIFSVPGDYVLRVRANDYSGNTSGGHAQCCWTNGFVKVTVSE